MLLDPLPNSVSVPRHAGFVPGVAGASLSLGHLLFYFLDLNSIEKHNQSYLFSIKMLLYVPQCISALPVVSHTSIIDTWILVEHFIISQVLIVFTSHCISAFHCLFWVCLFIIASVSEYMKEVMIVGTCVNSDQTMVIGHNHF